MQPVSEAQARILACAAPLFDFGCELLNPDLSVAEDISADLVGGSVSRNMLRSPHGQCEIRLSRALPWGRALVRLYKTVTDTVTGESARWNEGVYVLTTPTSRTGEDPVTYDVDGKDRLYLLSRPVGADFSLAAGITYRTAFETVFTAAGLTGVLIEGSAADDTLPKVRDWPLVATSNDPDQTDTPVTWLRIVNDLAQAINFRAVWADQDGRFRCQAYQPPTDRAPEFTFTDDQLVTILSEDRETLENTDGTPNRWAFRWTNAPEGTAAGDLVYDYELPDSHPLSAVNRGLDWPSVVDYEAASRAKLVEQGDRRVASDLRRTVKYELSTASFPPAGHFDVFTYTDIGGSRKVQAVEWQMPLNGDDMNWTWELIA